MKLISMLKWALLKGFLLYLVPTLLTSQGIEYTPLSEIHQGGDSCYLYVQDNQNQEWIFKQIPNSDSNSLDLLIEVLASRVAQKLHIPLNHVELISSNSSFQHRIVAGQLGSLHLKVPGTQVSELSDHRELFLQQRHREGWRLKKLGALPFEETGLTPSVIQSMSKHPSLAKLVALDTYLGNIDRTLLNLFYDPKTQEYYGIDMGNSFKGNLANQALLKIESFRESQVEFSPEEIEGLKVYLRTLKGLAYHYPPGYLIALFDDVLIESQILAYEWTETTLNRIQITKERMRESYISTLKLIDRLEEFLR